MKLTQQMVDELFAIGHRLNDLEEMALANLPISRNIVLDSYGEELTSYKIDLEQMFEKTDKKEWFLLTYQK